MNIYKPFIYTFVLVLLDTVIGLITYRFIEPVMLESDSFQHYFGWSDIIITCIIYYIVVYLIMKRKIQWSRVGSKVKSLELKIVLLIVIIEIGLHFMERPMFDFTRILDKINGLEPINYEYSNDSDFWILFYRGLPVLILAPIFEELLFRKIFFTSLLQRYSLKTSIIVSSVCFALIHLPSFRNLLPTFILGVLACLIYYKTKNILYPIFMHFVGNLIWFILSMRGEQFYDWIFGLNYDLTYWVLVISGGLLVWLGLKSIMEWNNYKI
jgi:membrane protease YdiL (CAAX protease family)